MDIEKNKSQLRKLYRSQRKDRFLSENWLHILSASEFVNVKNVASYISYEVEPDTSEINKQLMAVGKNLFLPRLLADGDIEWVPWDGSKEKLKATGKSFEPIGDAQIVELDVIIVPALHVDPTGMRLGQGGGSYDRALAKSRAWNIALLHRGELTSELLPTQSHDQKVDAAATPEIIVRF
jgi:5-formyltetrahydrofolate cyclo-ligase